jgi:glutamine synthetase
MSFVRRQGAWTDVQHDAARAMAERLRAGDIATVRFSWADQHGILRGKTLVTAEALKVLEDGVGMVVTLLLKDTAHRTVWPVFGTAAVDGLPGLPTTGDVLLIPDPTTFRVLPWAPNSAWVQCEAFSQDGAPVGVCTRQLLKRCLARLSERGLTWVAGLEVEFHVFRLVETPMQPADAGQPGTPPKVELLSHGYQYLTEQRYDAFEPVAELLRKTLQGLGLALRSLEVEYGPSQFELTFDAAPGTESADAMVLLRSAIKQVCRRHGYHATFMCRPRLPNVFSSGWHLHQSLTTGAGANAFATEGGGLSATGQAWLGGLLAHAQGATALSTPTINGYRRFRPNSLAPDRVCWARDNRAAMLRVMDQGGAATRIENRAGEPAANPYLYFASQILSGLDGLERGLDPGAGADVPYAAEAPRLPAGLAHALAALEADATLCHGLGRDFVDYFCRIKRAELARFDLEVTEWEEREYFEMF